MMETVTQVINVQPREVTRQRDGVKFTIYEIFTNDGQKCSTTKRELAEQAQQLTGRNAYLTIEVSQNGDYVNRYLNAIRSAPESAPSDLAAPAPAVPLVEPSAAVPAPPAVTERDLQIWRQVATKVAVGICQARKEFNASEFWANVDALIEFYSTGRKP